MELCTDKNLANNYLTGNSNCHMSDLFDWKRSKLFNIKEIQGMVNGLPAIYYYLNSYKICHPEVIWWSLNHRMFFLIHVYDLIYSPCLCLYKFIEVYRSIII